MNGDDRTDGAADGPRVSIGLPVYNGAGTIGDAIAALRAQTFSDFELVISDNASDDATHEICLDAAAGDPRIRLIRQPENIGPIGNFAAVLAEARAPYFLFAAADDRVAPHLVEETLGLLAAHPGAVACAPRTLIHLPDGRTREARGSGAIGGPGWWRPARFLLRPADNSRFYGLYRTEVMRRAYLAGESFHAFDWAVSALTLSEGAHLRSRTVVLEREGAVRGKYRRQHVREAGSAVTRLFPLVPMSRALLARLPAGQRPLALIALFWLNLQKAIEYLPNLSSRTR